MKDGRGIIGGAAVIALAGLAVGSFAVVNSQSTVQNAGSGSSNISSCDTDYKVSLAQPTYDEAKGDFVIASASTDKLEDSCVGQTVSVRVLNNSGATVGSGSAQPNNSTKIATVTFESPVPVASAYKVKTLIYGTGSSGRD
jgi:hypothetical protein